MGISYDIFTDAFLSKISEYSFLKLSEYNRMTTVDGYMKRAISEFKNICKYDLTSSADDISRMFFIDIDESDIDELTNIISEGMIVQWLKPYVFKQELLENAMNTRDFTTYSPAELLLRIGNAYRDAQKSYTQMIREYSYNHGDLTDLHL